MEDNAELESFRRQWREEVTRRSRPKVTPLTPTPTAPPLSRLPPTRHEASHRNEVEEEGPPLASFDPDELAQQVGELSVEQAPDDFSRREVAEPTSALEHFERAVEKEAEGNLGDSLSHYRKAYRVSLTIRHHWHRKLIQI
jgi:F-box protein 9